MKLVKILAMALACAACIVPGYAQEAANSSTAPQTEPAKPHRIRIASAVAQGFLAKKVDPVYPAGVDTQGIVVLHVLISSDGVVEGAEFISGPPVFQKNSVDAVLQWKYRPYILNGNPVAVETTVILNFRR